MKFDSTNITDLRRLAQAVDELSASGGGDCKEYGIEAIYDAIMETDMPDLSNIIVMTDAPAKDIVYKMRLINATLRRAISINFLISPSSCHSSSRDTEHYRQIAQESCGAVVENINDIEVLSTFLDAVTSVLATETCNSKRKRTAGKCIEFHSTLFTETINILFSDATRSISISTPEREMHTINPVGLLASFTQEKPSNGKYTICSDGAFSHQIVLKSNLDYFVEFYEDNRLTIGKIY